MKKYTYTVNVRVPENLADSMKKICNQFTINESDYVRKSLRNSIEKDLSYVGKDDRVVFI